MVFDAYKTSEAIQHGCPSGSIRFEAMFGPGLRKSTTAGQKATSASSSPSAEIQPGLRRNRRVHPTAGDNRSCNNDSNWAVILIGLGCLILLDNIGWFSFSMSRFWPLILIVIGAWLFFKRWNRRLVRRENEMEIYRSNRAAAACVAAFAELWAGGANDVGSCSCCIRSMCLT